LHIALCSAKLSGKKCFMKPLSLLFLLFLTSCLDGYGFRYNPIFQLSALKSYINGDKKVDSSFLFKKRAYCFYYNKEGRSFLKKKFHTHVDKIEVKGDFTPGLNEYDFEVYNKITGAYLARITMECEYGGSNFCKITELLNETDNQKEPRIPVCEDL
jgi:hypothetical protein